MPTIKDFEQKHPRSEKHSEPHSSVKSDTKKKRRRPGRDHAAEADTHLEDVPAEVQAAESEIDASTQTEAQTNIGDFARTDEHHGEETGTQKVHLEFYGSEILRERAPKAFEFAEAVATDWVNDGRFEALPVGHPMAQLAAQVGFRKAKDVEKKLEEKGVFMLARVGIEYAKAKFLKK